ncbi:MAG: ABC transporter permease [Firmicutes bacterium]|nr:ABC transporter permease [Bacillota bacterium]
MVEPEPAVEVSEPVAAERPRFWRHLLRNRGAAASLGLLAVFVLVAAGAQWIAPYNPNAQNLLAALQPPSALHLLGTDEYGRDVLSRLLFGARTALLAAVAVVAVSMVAGAVWGLASAYYGGWVDTLLMRVVDVFMAFPFLLLALMIVAALGSGVVQAVIAVAISYMPVYARLVRGVALGLKELDFVQAARSLGAPGGWIMRRHLVPNLVGPIIVQATLNMGTAIIDISGLSFLGMGVQPPQSDWGAMLADAQTYILQAEWLVLAPGLAILLVVLAFNLFGDGLRDALDPRVERH